MYFIGRGEILIADRNQDGSPANFEDVGEVPVFEFNIETQFVENTETKTAIGRMDLRVPVSQSGKGMMQVKEHTAKNLALALYGETEETAGGAFEDVAFPAGIAAGDIRQVPGARINLSAVTIEDSDAVEPNALEAGTHYKLHAEHGLVEFISVSGLTQPFKISGTEGASTTVRALTKRAPEKVIFFKGINLADGETPCIVQIHRGQVDPTKKLSGKQSGNEVAVLDIEFTILDDPTKDDDGLLGSYLAYRTL